MAIKSTDRVKIQAYGSELSATFTDIRNSLEELVNGVATANYEGGNAVQFKQSCVDSSVVFAEQCQKAMELMADDVRNQTSYIATALGGAEVTVDVPAGAVERPAISSDESVELADSDALNTMMSLVGEKMGAISGFFDQNMDDFNRLGTSNGWVGEEYDVLQGQIRTTTSDVQGDLEVAKGNLVTTIENQLAALGMA